MTSRDQTAGPTAILRIAPAENPRAIQSQPFGDHSDTATAGDDILSGVHALLMRLSHKACQSGSSGDNRFPHRRVWTSREGR